MKLSIQNFGPISSAELDLSKDLIILTGENNTGKTYVANAVAAVTDENSNMLPHLTTLAFTDSQNIDFSSNFEIDIQFSIKQLLEIHEQESRIIDLEHTKETVYEYLNTKNVENASIDINYASSSEQLKNKYWLKSFEQHYNSNSGMVISKESKSFLLKISFKSDDANNNENTFKLFLPHILSQCLNYSIFFIPAERQGINLFNKELSLIKNQAFNNLLSNGKREEMLNFFTNRFNRYPKSIQNALNFTQNLDFTRTQKSPFAYLSDELDQLLQGKLSINEQGDILFHPKHEETLEISMTSSTVKSLSWLSIYLRHVAKQGDFIIIDEPELNLHPNNQVKIARFLSRLVYEGFKLMISTHSDYIIRELNTLIMLHSGYQKQNDEASNLMIQYNYQQNELLDKDKVGVYLFRQNKAVENVPIEVEGFQIETIDKTVDQLNRSSQNIYFELF
ncbi:MAG: AAA family ATPase [Bacteroidota bacterium]